LLPSDNLLLNAPQIVNKRQRRLKGMYEIVLSLTAKGLTKNRGTGDVCIVVCDGLKGLPEAITAVWAARSSTHAWFSSCAEAACG
jgi:transposase-like protein